MNVNEQTWEQPALSEACGLDKESKVKLSLEVRNQGDVVIVHCHGRIVYREEAAALSRLFEEVSQHGGKVVVDLGGVTALDSAGIGELAWLQTRAYQRRAELKYAGANPRVRSLLQLTRLDSVLDLNETLGEALTAFQEDRVCADC